jgi:electron transfer flavoprotein beta subunit
LVTILFNFVLVSNTADETAITAIREIDGGKETVSSLLPLITGQKVEEKDLRIPNMRGIMTQFIPALPIAGTYRRSSKH